MHRRRLMPLVFKLSAMSDKLTPYELDDLKSTSCRRETVP